MTYTLWQLIATLNEWFFPGSYLEKNYINICRCNNSSDFHDISLYHRHLHDVTGTSSCFWRIQPYIEFIDILVQANRFTLHQCIKINRFVCKIFAFRTQNDRLFLFRVLQADFEATSKVVSSVNMESSGGYDMWQNFMPIRVEQHSLIFSKISGYCVRVFYQKRRTHIFLCLVFDHDRLLRIPVTTIKSVPPLRYMFTRRVVLGQCLVLVSARSVKVTFSDF